MNSLYRSFVFLCFLCTHFLCINMHASHLNDVQKGQGLFDEEFFGVSRAHKNLMYYLYIEDFINSFIQIPTSNLSEDSTTVSSEYLAGNAPIYNKFNKKAGTCSASFLCMQNNDRIFADITNYLVADNGLIVSWLTPSTLMNLELDTIIRGMVTKCIVTGSTKVGYNPYYGKTFNMIVSADQEKIYFKLRELNQK